MSHKLSHIPKTQQTKVNIQNFKEYCLSFIYTQNYELDNGWGWFVDTELQIIDDTHNCNRFIRPSKYASIPETIMEHSSIRRSMKSLKNIQETYDAKCSGSNNFELNNNLCMFNNEITNMICANTIGILSCAIIYYIVL